MYYVLLLQHKITEGVPRDFEIFWKSSNESYTFRIVNQWANKFQLGRKKCIGVTKRLNLI